MEAIDRSGNSIDAEVVSSSRPSGNLNWPNLRLAPLSKPQLIQASRSEKFFVDDVDPDVLVAVQCITGAKQKHGGEQVPLDLQPSV